jgi:poly(3-hydroxybutyrate) depolymerase
LDGDGDVGGARGAGGADGLGGTSGAGGAMIVMDAGVADVSSLEPDAQIRQPPPADVPQPRAVTGTCPEFTAGTNAIDPNGQSRQVDVYLPDEPAGAPVLFIWHGLGDSAPRMGRAFGAQRIADGLDAIVVVPHSSGRFVQSEWSFIGGDAEVDGAVFDETLSCLYAQFGIDMDRVYSTGFSAGALWSTWLLMNRSEYLAAVTLFSGGAGGVNPYRTPAHDTPVLAFFGGPTDVYGGGVINFAEMTNELVGNLVSDGHFVVLCDHDEGHSIPLDPMAYAMPFLLDHRFSVVTSPYADGLGNRWADYCVIQGD